MKKGEILIVFAVVLIASATVACGQEQLPPGTYPIQDAGCVADELRVRILPLADGFGRSINVRAENVDVVVDESLTGTYVRLEEPAVRPFSEYAYRTEKLTVLVRTDAIAAQWRADLEKARNYYAPRDVTPSE